MLNPFMSNGISHYYKLGQYISVLGVLGAIFHIFPNFNRRFCKKTVETLIWVCTVLPMSHKKDAGLIWVYPYKPNVLFVRHRQILQTQIRYLIKVSTVCLQNIQSKLNKNEKYHPTTLKIEMDRV